jgi:hypothetical protein
MNGNRIRVFLIIFVGSAASWLVGWALDKVTPRSKLRDAMLTGVCIYLALTVDSLLLK